MNRTEYLNRLKKALSGLPEQDISDALMYYDEYFYDAGKENEQKVIEELGTPEQVAAGIRADMAVKIMSSNTQSKAKNGMTAFWAVILCIFALPIGVPIAIAIAAVAFGGFVTIAALVFSMICLFASLALAGIVAVVAGIVLLFTSLPSGIFYLGAGLFAIGIGILAGSGCVKLVGIIINGMTKLIHNMRTKSKPLNKKEVS